VSTRSDQGYENYEPPKNEKRHPLTRRDTEKLYQTAVDYPDREAELTVRVLLDFGLRLGELLHCREHWVDKEYHREADGEVWRIKVPKVEFCWGGKGGNIGQGNPDGADLHSTNNPCTDCVNRSWQKKVAPLDDDGEPQPDRGWLTESQAEKFDFAPKSARSATKVWQFPGIDEMGETAQLLKEFLQAQSHGQWPHGGNPARTRIDRVAEAADLDLPDRSQKKIVPHALRHTYGCRLVEMGVGEGTGMKQMRHQNANVFRWYSDVRGTRVISALDDAASENDSLL